MNTRRKFGLLFLNNSAHSGMLSRFSGSMLSQMSRILQLLKRRKFEKLAENIQGKKLETRLPDIHMTNESWKAP